MERRKYLGRVVARECGSGWLIRVVVEDGSSRVVVGGLIVRNQIHQAVV